MNKCYKAKGKMDGNLGKLVQLGGFGIPAKVAEWLDELCNTQYKTRSTLLRDFVIGYYEQAMNDQAEQTEETNE